MIGEPSPNGVGGDRDAGGRFAPGNRGGPGNPHARAVAELRAAILRAVSPEEMEAILRKLVEQAKAGNISAAKEVLDRCLGRPVEADLIARIEELESREARSWRG